MKASKSNCKQIPNMEVFMIKEKECIKPDKTGHNKTSKKNHKTERLFIAAAGNSI